MKSVNQIVTKEQLIAYISARNFTVIATFGEQFPESACVEFGNDGLTLIFDTNSGSRKFSNIQKNPKVSLVIGWEDERTVQYEGIATLLEEDSEELDHLKKAYFKKNPKAQKWETIKGNVYFKVEPRWIRFTDLNLNPWNITVFNDFNSESSRTKVPSKRKKTME